MVTFTKQEDQENLKSSWNKEDENEKIDSSILIDDHDITTILNEDD